MSERPTDPNAVAFLDANGYLYYWCPGCKEGLAIPTQHAVVPTRWTFNGDLLKPTLSPSILQFHPRPDGSRKTICHHFVRDGKIEFCSDSPHALSGQTVAMTPGPDWPYGWE